MYSVSTCWVDNYFIGANLDIPNESTRRGRFKFAEFVPDPIVYNIFTIKYVQTKPPEKIVSFFLKSAR